MSKGLSEIPSLCMLGGAPTPKSDESEGLIVFTRSLCMQSDESEGLIVFTRSLCMQSDESEGLILFFLCTYVRFFKRKRQIFVDHVVVLKRVFRE